MRTRLRLMLSLAFVLFILLLPASVLAQGSEGEDGLLLRINGPVTVAENETIENIIVIGDNATIEGTVTGTLFVFNGDAYITGTVEQDVTVVRGTLDLASTATVDNITVYRGEVVRDAGATVTGTTTDTDFQVNLWDWGIFWAFLWIGTTLTILVAGVVFAAVGSKQLKASGDTITGAPGPALLAAAAAWIVMPILMFMAFFTLVGIPLSVGYFFFVLPIFWFLGYLVAGTQIGRMILRSRYDEPHPYLAAILGLLLLQLIGIIPLFGGLVAFVAGVIGSGALIVLGWHAWRGPGEAQVAMPAGTTEPHPVT